MGVSMRKTGYALTVVAGAGLLAGDIPAPREAVASSLLNSGGSSTAAASSQSEAVARDAGEAATTPAVWRHYTWQPWTGGNAGPRPYARSYGSPRYAFPNWGRVPPRSAPPWSRRRAGPWAGPRDYAWNYGWRGYRRDGWTD